MASEGTGSLRQGGQSAGPSVVMAEGIWAPGDVGPAGTQKLSREGEATLRTAKVVHGDGPAGSPSSCYSSSLCPASQLPISKGSHLPLPS